jgi:diguanylate cyclase (GGDEF)-like protein/PAS domain S-box-containing protein
MANIFLAIIYFIVGLLTLSLSLPPSGGTVLWAPTGIALAVVLIWGYRLLPGVFLGDFLVAHYLVGAEHEYALSLCILFGVQAALQAALGRYLLIHFRVWPSTLVEGGEILKFFIIAAVLSTLIPALLIVSAELGWGILTPDSWFYPMLMWWVGSALGVVIFTPITLILLASPQRVWHTRIVSVVVPMLLLFITLVFLLHGARANELSQISHRFNDNVKLAHSLVERKVELQTSFLKNMRAFFQNSEQVSEQEFNAYTQDFFAETKQNDAARTLAWIERVNHKNRLTYEQQHGYLIQEVDFTTGVLMPALVRDDYYVMHYLNSGKRGLLPENLIYTPGLDVCAANEYQTICQQMAITGQGQVMPYLDDRSGLIPQQQFLYLLPVFDDQQQLMGMICHLSEYSVLIEDFLTSASKQWIEVTLIEPDNKTVLFSTSANKLKPMFSAAEPLVFREPMDEAGHRWLFNYSPSQDFIDNYSSPMSFWIMMAAFIVFSLIALWLMTLTGRAQSIKIEVKSKTREIALHAKLLAKNEEKYRCLVENIQDEYLIYSYDSRGVYSYISPSITEILGYEQQVFLNHYSTYMPESDLNKLATERIMQTLSGQASSSYDMELRAKSGELHIFRVHENAIYDDDNESVVGVEGIARDITESKKAQVALEKLSLAMKHSPNAVVITDREGNIEYVNPKFTTITGYSENEAIGKWPDIISSEDTDSDVYKDLWQTLLSGLEWRGELKNRKKNGDLYWAQEVVAPMLDASNNVTHFIVTQQDITEAHQLNEKKAYQASHDSLTGLMNRQEFEQRLKRAISSSKRDLTEHALCFLDLDQFKTVNDTCGHVAGDEMLRQIGTLLSTNVRSRDTLARLGGDEFALLMEHCGIEQAHQACEQLISLLEHFRFHWEEHVFTVGVSIGLSIIDQHIQDNTEAMNNVDMACYAAKNNGRNQVKVHIEDHARLQKRRGEIQWNSEISHALDNDRLLLYAQPIVALSEDASCVGYEVLLRLQMTDGTIVPPGAFLPAAERYHSATRIDRWVFNHTLHWMNQHQDELAHISSISINLSGQSLNDEAMIDYIIHEFEHGDIPAGKIKFEITETAAIANLHDATLFIKTLREFGCRFALDDFGSGLSSFAYLKNLKVDTLKIDGMFVKDMLTDTLDYEMVKSINEIGHVMGLETVAEFVESEEILDKLKEIGVDYAQGYSLGKPVSIDEILKKPP